MNGFPHYFQTDSESAGITCLQIISKHYGSFHSLDRLRAIATNFRNGSSLLIIRNTAEALGFRAKTLKANLQNLAAIHHPCILQLSEDRFVVLFKIKRNVAYVSDPETGLSKHGVDELLHSAGIAGEGSLLMLTPRGDLDESTASDGSIFWYLLTYLKPHRKLLTQVLLGFLASGILSLFFPLLTQAAVDIGIGTSDLDFIVIVLLAQVILIISHASIEFLRNWILLDVSVKIIITLLSDFLIKLLRLPIGFYQKKLIGDIRQRIEDNARVHEFLTKNLIGMLFGALIFIIYSIIIGIYDIRILLIYYCGCTIYVTWVLSFLKRRKTLDAKRFKEAASNQNKMYEMLTAIQDIKLNGWEDRKRWEWEHVQMQLFKISLLTLKLNQFQNAGALIITQSVALIISYMSAKAVIQGEITLGAMFAIQFIIGQLSAPINDFILFVTSAQDTKMSLERIQEINNEPDESAKPFSTYELPADHSIIIKDLSFGYTANEVLLKNISICIPQGKVTAIVGESGSGKTTLLRLILRYFDVRTGQINIGQKPLHDLDVNVWRSHCGSVMQDGMIFSDTIANNIALGHPYVNNQQLEYAVDVASIKELIQQLPLGYNTLVGNGGMNLSQGQRQRLLIARAVYRNPSFLFFDEATNALDTKNEAAIVEKLNSFYEGRTVIIVAHRLSTVQTADQILVLNQGRIIEYGDHRTLYRQKGHYYALVKNQLDIPV